MGDLFIHHANDLNSRFRELARRCCEILVFLLIFPAYATAQAAVKTDATPFSHTQPSPAKLAPGTIANEQRTAKLFETVRENPADLESFLLRMPKGADLHNHLGGDIYAESLIREGAEDRLCVDQGSLSLVKPQSGAGCAKNQVPTTQALSDQHLFDALVDAFSMRGFVPSTGVTGHDHFFDAFAKFQGIDSSHEGEWLDEVATRAAAQNEQYLELMDTPDFSHIAAVASQIGWKDDLSQMRDELLARGLGDDVAQARARFDRAEALRRQREHCGEQNEASACRVEIRFLYQILRDLPKELVFAQTLLGLETASADPRVVGINYVRPEDDYTSMSDYAQHMRIVGFLHGLYPKVHISLHAGELAPGLVPYEGLCCHIRLAVEEGHAERIGHGVDVMYEDRPSELLREMAAKHILVEINLTSNDIIFGINGKDHPFPIYRKFGVPVALSTDDEGVSRIDLTHEYVRAAQTYNLHYADFKQMVRDSLEHSFLAGNSLWSAPENFGSPVSACSQATLGEEKPSPGCAAFLQHSEKAQQQWETRTPLSRVRSRPLTSRPIFLNAGFARCSACSFPLSRANNKRRPRWPPLFFSPKKLEKYAERHLNLPRASDRLHDLSETCGAEIEPVGRGGCAASGGQSRGRTRPIRRLGHRERAEGQVLIHIVNRYVEAWVVRQVVNINAVFQPDPLRYLRLFHNRNIAAFLPGLPENVSLAARGDEVGFERIARRNRAAQGARCKQRYIEARCLECRDVGIVAGCAGQCVLRRAPGSKRDDGIRNSVTDAVIDASDGSGIVNYAVGLPALERYQALDAPSVPPLCLPTSSPGTNLGSS